MPSKCDERIRLEQLYAESRTELSKLLAKLSKSAGLQENGMFDREWEMCEAQRRVCSQTSAHIHAHLRQHRRI